MKPATGETACADLRSRNGSSGGSGPDRSPDRSLRSFELVVARRYMTAPRKQAIIKVVTLIAVAGVAVGVMALIIALSLMTGFSSDIQDKILGAEAHIFVRGDAVLGGLSEHEALRRELGKLEHVVATASNVLDQGILEGPLGSDRVTLRGVEPADEAVVTNIASHMLVGTLDNLESAGEGRPPIILGRELAYSLAARVGDNVLYRSFGGPVLSPMGPMMRRRTFRVVGIFETEMYEYDRSWALVSLGEAQRLMRLGEAVNAVKLRVDDFENIPDVTKEVRRVVGGRYLVKDLLSLNKPLFAAFKLEKLLMFIAIGLIVAVAALNIVTTLTMMVMEKTRDIGMLMAMGATPRQIMRIFMLQGLIIGVVGTALGLVVGVSASLLLDHYRVITLDSSVYFIPFLPFRVEPLDVTLVGVIAVLISFLATVWPALRAARLDPVESLRYE